MTDEESLAEAARHLGDAHGCLDVLVANAGVLYRKATLATDAATMLATFDTNVFGTVRTIHDMLPLLQTARHPRIVTVASTSASLTLTGDPATLYGQSDTSMAYSASKAAVTMLTVHYANAFRRSPAHTHIRINAATPGYIATELNGFAGTRSVEQGARIIIHLATLPDDGPSGGFFDEDGAVPW